MLYVWVENQTLCGTSIPECAPKNAILYENYKLEDLDKFYLDNGVIKIKNDEQILEEKKDRFIKLMKNLYYEKINRHFNVIIDFLLTKTLEEEYVKKQYFENMLMSDIDKIVKIRKEYVDNINEIKAIDNLTDLNNFCERMGCYLD